MIKKILISIKFKNKIVIILKSKTSKNNYKLPKLLHSKTKTAISHKKEIMQLCLGPRNYFDICWKIILLKNLP